MRIESCDYPVGRPVVDEDFFAPDEAAATYSPDRPRTTRSHRTLIDGFAAPSTPAEAALLGCLTALRDGRITEEWCVGVIDADTTGHWGAPLPG